jgi:acetyl esterase/lipase
VKTFLLVVGSLLAAGSGLYFFRVRSPAGAPLTIPKMFVSQGAAIVAGTGASIAVFGLALGSIAAAALGAVAIALSLRYLLRVAARHDGFERAFGPDWQRRISPEHRGSMLARRWVGRLPDPPEARWERDIAFRRIPGSSRELLCDLWQPPEGTPPSHLSFLYFHGSGWHWLDKDFNTRRFFRHLCAQGHVVMDVAYRLCPEVDAYGMLGDVKRAIAWMKENAEKYDVDPQRVVTGGGSAGGHLALLAAYTPDHPELTPDDVKEADLSVSAVASYYGPVDMRAYYDHAAATMGEAGEDEKKGRKRDPNRDGIFPRISQAALRFVMGDLFDRIKDQEFPISHRQMMANLLGGQPDEIPYRYKLFSPITHAGPNSPPTLLLQGEHDSQVPASVCRALHRKLVRLGVPVVHVEYPQTEHAFDVAILSRYSPAAQAALYELERFLSLV